MWHPGAARGGGANEAYLSRCFAALAPISMLLTAELLKFEIEQVIIEIGEWGGVSGHKVVWIHSLARSSVLNGG